MSRHVLANASPPTLLVTRSAAIRGILVTKERVAFRSVRDGCAEMMAVVELAETASVEKHARREAVYSLRVTTRHVVMTAVAGNVDSVDVVRHVLMEAASRPLATAKSAEMMVVVELVASANVESGAKMESAFSQLAMARNVVMTYVGGPAGTATVGRSAKQVLAYSLPAITRSAGRTVAMERAAPAPLEQYATKLFPTETRLLSCVKNAYPTVWTNWDR
jgi:hypothetical protein